jgi:hypothetical protein
MIPAGFQNKKEGAHVAQLMVFRDFIVVCNRGIGRPDDKPSLFAFPSDAAKLSVEQLIKIRDLADNGTMAEFTELLYQTLPAAQIPTTCSPETTQFIERLSSLKIQDQTVGNCWYAGPELALQVLFHYHLQDQFSKTEIETLFDQCKTVLRSSAWLESFEGFLTKPPSVQGKIIRGFLDETAGRALGLPSFKNASAETP